MRALSAVLLLAGCPVWTDPGPTEPLLTDHWSNAGSGDGGAAQVGPVAVGRVSRRLSVHQLEGSMRTLTGSGWEGTYVAAAVNEDGGDARAPIDGLQFLGANLGRADYLNEFRENADISASFVKYLDNWFAESCWELVSADYGATDAGARRFVRELPELTGPDGGISPERRRASLENLRLARLHFQSVFTAPSDVAQLQPLADTIEAAAARLKPQYGGTVSDAAAWSLGCTLMLTDPEFVTY